MLRGSQKKKNKQTNKKAIRKREGKSIKKQMIEIEKNRG